MDKQVYKKPTKNTKKIELNIKELREEISKKHHLIELSLLKHKIMNLILPLDIDWQGILEISKNDKNKANIYLKKIKGSYKNLLEILWFYLLGERLSKNKIKVRKNELPNKKSVSDILSPYESKEEVESKWKEILTHCGLEKSSSDEIKIDKELGIVKYFQKLKNRNISINDFLNNFMVNNRKYNFHSWYLELGDLFDDLKKLLE
jgi:hypothetical protein